MGIFPYRSLGEFQTALFQSEPAPPMETTWVCNSPHRFKKREVWVAINTSHVYLFALSTDLRLNYCVCYSSTKLLWVKPWPPHDSHFSNSKMEGCHRNSFLVLPWMSEINPAMRCIDGRHCKEHWANYKLGGKRFLKRLDLNKNWSPDFYCFPNVISFSDWSLKENSIMSYSNVSSFFFSLSLEGCGEETKSLTSSPMTKKHCLGWEENAVTRKQQLWSRNAQNTEAALSVSTTCEQPSLRRAPGGGWRFAQVDTESRAKCSRKR